MKNKVESIRIKLVKALLSSVGLATLLMFVLCYFLIVASTIKPFAIFFYEHILIFIVVFLLIFAISTIKFFQLLSSGSIHYLEEITENLGRITEGKLDINIPVRTNDELGKMADTVNNMAYRLRTTLEEEKRLEKTKNDLITNVSHDLRTPLTSALGYLELITYRDIGNEEKVRQYGEIAYSQCRDLKILIDDLFEFSKLSNPGMTLNLSRISLGELIEQVMLGFIPALHEAGMEYRLFMGKERISIDADPFLLTRVMDNLISNAIKYGSEGKLLEVELEKAGDEALIKVVNYGKAIPAEDIPYVFERFYRADKARTRQDGGSGLGLAIVKSIVELHGGSTVVHSADNRTVFEVRLKAE